MARVFISHSSQNADFVEQQINAPLRQHGIETFYSPVDIQTATQWEAEIRKNLEDCDWFLVAASSESQKSEWVIREIRWALDHRRDRIVPVIIGAISRDDWPLGLFDYQWLDFTSNLPGQQQRLVATWNGNLTGSRGFDSSAHHPFVGRVWRELVDPCTNYLLESLPRENAGRDIDAIQKLTGYQLPDGTVDMKSIARALVKGLTLKDVERLNDLKNLEAFLQNLRHFKDDCLATLPKEPQPEDLKAAVDATLCGMSKKDAGLLSERDVRERFASLFTSFKNLWIRKLVDRPRLDDVDDAFHNAIDDHRNLKWVLSLVLLATGFGASSWILAKYDELHLALRIAGLFCMGAAAILLRFRR